MADAMVTGRMSAAKKEAGNRVLKSLGLSASQAINQLYDRLIEEQQLPFAQTSKKQLTEAQREEAHQFVSGIPHRNSLSNLDDDAIKRRKLAAKAHL